MSLIIKSKLNSVFNRIYMISILLFLFQFFLISCYHSPEIQIKNSDSTMTYSMLNLGDSYTIGEAVEIKDRFPMQTIELLKKDGINFSDPKIIARTGWTTDELQQEINNQNIQKRFDFVTLLIGVNNQYRNYSIDEYRLEFRSLLEQALVYAKNDHKRVVVISIPDWGVTPFAEGRDRALIAQQIDAFNLVNKEEAELQKVYYISITEHSRLASNDLSLVASDGLHPSGKMYTYWSELLSNMIADELK